MRHNRVLLIKPSYKGSYYGALHPPVGIGYIAESLAAHNIEYAVMDMSFKYGMKDLIRKIRTFCPDLLGFSMMSFMYHETYEHIRQIKKVFPDIHIIIGGAHASTFREKVLESVSGVDFATTFEGEEVIVDLCKGKPLSEIKGLVFRTDDGKVFYNGDREFIQDLDSLPAV